MAATAEQVARLRRMVAEPTEGTYTDEELAKYIEAYPLRDERGEEPYTWDTATTPPTPVANDAWVATYDLHAAAADIWEEKAASLAADYDFTADGATHHLTQAYQQHMERVRYHRARRVPKTATLTKWPEETTSSRFPWIGNLPEDD